MERFIYTLGHSNHSLQYFIELLKAHAVNCVADVRSIAASRFNPHFNKRALQAGLTNAGITYIHMAKEFGARRENPEGKTLNGKLDFEKVRESEIFKNGIKRLLAGTNKGYVIALTCAEADPLSCHRFGMIAPALKDAGLHVLHILKDKSLISQDQLEDKLLRLYSARISADDPNPLLTAYRLLNRKIGFKIS